MSRCGAGFVPQSAQRTETPYPSGWTVMRPAEAPMDQISPDPAPDEAARDAAVAGTDATVRVADLWKILGVIPDSAQGLP